MTVPKPYTGVFSHAMVTSARTYPLGHWCDLIKNSKYKNI